MSIKFIKSMPMYKRLSETTGFYFLRSCRFFLPCCRHYLGYRRFVREARLQVRTTDETIDYIVSHRVSVSRFGDGELKVIGNGGNGFQHPDAALAARLREVLLSEAENHIVCLPRCFTDASHMNMVARSFWYGYLSRRRTFIIGLTRPERTYFDASFTRFYMDFRDKSHVGQVVENLRRIWDGRDLFIVEGEYSLLGVGNDLFDNARSIRRIVCPSRDAFARYEDIKQTVVQHVPKESLVLCALGMTATVLCYDLSQLGFQAIDIGHVDIEYSWYRMGARRKCPVPGKAVNEAGVFDLGYHCTDPAYVQSIVATVI